MAQHDDNQDNRRDRGLGLTTTQVTGSALAAMSGAFFASWAGTTGTLIGAAVGSVIATVGAATYTWSLRRTGDAVKRTAAQVRQTALVTGTLPRTVSDGPLRPDEDQQPSANLEEVPPARRRFDLPWAKVALASLAVTVLGLAGITVVEAVTGNPISAVFGKDTGSGTTVGRVIGTDSGSSQEEKAPSKDTDEPATPEPTPTEEPAQEPQPEETVPSTVPEPTPTTDPAVPTEPQESQAPAPQGVQP